MKRKNFFSTKVFFLEQTIKIFSGSSKTIFEEVTRSIFAAFLQRKVRQQRGFRHSSGSSTMSAKKLIVERIFWSNSANSHTETLHNFYVFEFSSFHDFFLYSLILLVAKRKIMTDYIVTISSYVVLSLNYII